MVDRKVTKCGECIAELRNVFSAIGLAAKRANNASNFMALKKQAGLIYEDVKRCEKILKEKNGK